jgi:alcohol dehydrogenase class IV
LEKFIEVARLLGEDVGNLSIKEDAKKSIRGMENLLDKVNMNLRLADLGVEKRMIDEFIKDASKSHLLKTNPRFASPEDMREIYNKSL